MPASSLLGNWQGLHAICRNKNSTNSFDIIFGFQIDAKPFGQIYFAWNHKQTLAANEQWTLWAAQYEVVGQARTGVAGSKQSAVALQRFYVIREAMAPCALGPGDGGGRHGLDLDAASQAIALHCPLARAHAWARSLLL